MISYYETVRGTTWAIVLNEKGEIVSRQQVAFKKGPSLGGWHPADEPAAPPSRAGEGQPGR